MSLSHVTHWNIQWVYLLSDLIVLALSLTYIPAKRLVYSLLTVILSGQLIGLIQRAGSSQTDAPDSSVPEGTEKLAHPSKC